MPTKRKQGSAPAASKTKRPAPAADVLEELCVKIVDSVQDYAIFTMDTERRVISWSPGAENTFGWTADEMKGKSGDIIFVPEDVRNHAPEKEAATAVAEGRAPDERFHLDKYGSRFYVSGVMTPLRDKDGRHQGFVKIARDMTDRIAANEAFDARATLERLVHAQERERARIARDLHDEFGQQLTVLRHRLESLKKDIEEHDVSTKVAELEAISHKLDQCVDRITWELRPLTLEDLGLVPALQKYITDWCAHWNVACDLLASSLKKTRFNADVETNLYRIVQEALNNVAKHSKAKHVEVMFERRDDLLILVIEDDGKGFSTFNKRLMVKGLGLTGMRERAALIGGSLEIESAPGKGTTIYVRIPAAAAMLSEKKRGRKS